MSKINSRKDVQYMLLKIHLKDDKSFLIKTLARVSGGNDGRSVDGRDFSSGRPVVSLSKRTKMT